ncbi:MAG TPA: HD domain-containing protein [Desulfobacteria bacterium]|nr:HD domain-containing protein [Desulfobacteria bacterium]
MEIRNALYGDIILSDEEASILDTYEMQRLRHVAQLGFVNLVYPCANHTRFEHSIGTRWMAQKIVRLSGMPISRKDERLLYIAALLHDAAQPAYVHITERLSSMGMPVHRTVIKYILDGTYKEKVLEIKGDIETPFVCDVLKDEDLNSIYQILIGNRAYLTDLIDGYIDADSLDYLRRDSFYTGLPYGNYDDRVFSSFKIINIDNEERIGFKNSLDTLNSILSILNARFTLRKAVYLHHTSLIADEMFITALKYALSDNTINEYDIFISGDLELLLRMRDSDRAKPLVERLLHRRLFKRVFVLDDATPTHIRSTIEGMERDVTELNEARRRISEDSGVAEENILIGLPAPIAWKDYNKILLASDEGDYVELGTTIPSEIRLLEEKYRHLWSFGVYCGSSEYDTLIRLSNICGAYFGYTSKIKPKKPYIEVNAMKEILNDAISALSELNHASSKVLFMLSDKKKYVSRNELADELQIKPSTVSYYLSLIEKVLGDKGCREILHTKRIGRTKYWVIDEKYGGLIREREEDFSGV